MLLSLHTTKFNIYIVCTNKDIDILKELKRGSKLWLFLLKLNIKSNKETILFKSLTLYILICCK